MDVGHVTSRVEGSAGELRARLRVNTQKLAERDDVNPSNCRCLRPELRFDEALEALQRDTLGVELEAAQAS